MVLFERRKFGLFVLPLLLFGLCACKRDFSINSDSEAFPVVYGLLNVWEDEHYVKIFKSFVTEGNAYDVVNDIDKYSYIDSIVVYLNEYDENTILKRKILMDTTTAIPKDSGVFLSPTQILYVAKAVLNRDYLYEIEIINPYTKNIARTKVPIEVVGTVSITRPSGYVLSMTDRGMDFEFSTGKNITMYQLLLKFYYTEELSDSTNRQPAPIVWDIGSIVDPSAAAGMTKKISISSGSIFFQKIAENIRDNDNVWLRHTDSIVLEVYSAGRDWGLYIQSNLPTTGINQDRLHYTNIIAYNTETGEEKYAMGIFSSRGRTTRTYDDLALNGSRDSLFHGRYTGHLRFSDEY